MQSPLLVWKSQLNSVLTEWVFSLYFTVMKWYSYQFLYNLQTCIDFLHILYSLMIMFRETPFQLILSLLTHIYIRTFYTYLQFFIFFTVSLKTLCPTVEYNSPLFVLGVVDMLLTSGCQGLVFNFDWKFFRHISTINTRLSWTLFAKL